MAFIPTRRDDARQLCLDLAERYSNYLVRFHSLSTLLLMGDTNEARTLGNRLLKSSDTPFWYAKEGFEYLVNPANPKEFLANARESRIKQDGALFALAIQQFAEEKQDAAVDNLRRCIELNMFESENYWWSRALVKAIEAKREWLKGTTLDQDET
jgi:hypothetical protein